MNREQAIAALGGIEGARKTIEDADPGVGPFSFTRWEKEHAICTLALSALDAPSGDGWAALERARKDVMALSQGARKAGERIDDDTCAYRVVQAEADSFAEACEVIDRELAARPADAPSSHIASPAHVALWDAINAFTVASGGSASNTSSARQVAVASVEKALRDLLAARPAKEPGLDTLLASAKDHKMTDEEREAQRQSWARGNAPFDRPPEPGLTIAETASHMAALCDETVSAEDAEVDRWRDTAGCDPIDSLDGGGFRVYQAEIDAAVRIMRERGAAVKRAEKERDGNAAMCLNAVKEYKQAVERAEKAEGERDRHARACANAVEALAKAEWERDEAKREIRSDMENYKARWTRCEPYLDASTHTKSWDEIICMLAERAKKAEAEVARLQALVADVAKDMAKAIALMEATK